MRKDPDRGRRSAAAIRRAAVAAGDLILYVLRRFLVDRGLHVAAALSYTSCLAIVPLLAIVLATLASFPVFAGLREELQAFIFGTFLPPSGAALEEYVTRFLANTGKLTAVGVAGLAVTAVMLLATIEDAFNAIFRVRERRPWTIRILAFWTILTLGPSLFGASLSLSGELIAGLREAGVESWLSSIGGLAGLVSAVLAFLGFTLLYAVIPHRPVAWRHAMAGAAVAALLFNLLKKGFALYVAAAPVYQTIYGALAAVPIFLVWMYLSWAVVIAGAELVAALPEWRTGRRGGAATAPPAGQRLALALAVLAELVAAIRAGRRPSRRKELLRRLPVDEAFLDRLLHDLRQAGLVERTVAGGWVLVPELDRITFYDLYRALGLGVSPDEVRWLLAQVGDARLAGVLDAVEADIRAAIGRPLKEILDDATEPGAPKISRVG